MAEILMCPPRLAKPLNRVSGLEKGLRFHVEEHNKARRIVRQQTK